MKFGKIPATLVVPKVSKSDGLAHDPNGRICVQKISLKLAKKVLEAMFVWKLKGPSFSFCSKLFVAFERTFHQNVM